jgi:capsular exopolysaccharide synthesis family protein
MSKYAEFIEEDVKQIDLTKEISKYLSYWKWFVASLFICLVLAFVYLKFKLPGYEISTSILLKDDQKGGGTAEINAFKDMGLFTQKNNVDNELEMLNKAKIVKQAVMELGLYVNYIQMNKLQFVSFLNLDKTFPELGNYRYKVIYGDECPLLITLPENELGKIYRNIEFKVLVHPLGLYEFFGTFNDKKFNVKASISDNNVTLPFGKLLLKRGTFRPTEDMLINIILQNPDGKVQQFLSNLKMELTSKTTSVVNITLTAQNVGIGEDFLKKLIEVYNREDLDDQTYLANKTAQVIDDRLTLLTRELGDVESQVENYKQTQGITDIKSQSDMFVQQTSDFGQKRLDIETQLGIITDLNNFLQNRDNRLQLIPSNSGIKSPGLIELINNYNTLILKRNKFSRIASNSNQAMVDLNNQIESMFTTVQSSVQNEKNNLQIADRDLLSKNSENTANIRAVPRQEKEYTEIKRQQGVKEALYLFLLQKKEEKFLNLSLVEPTSKLIDEVSGSSDPVSPKRTLILFFAMIMGLLIPVIGIKIKDLLRYQIETKEELEELSTVPVLGEIQKTESKERLIIKENSTDSFTELMRLLRTNLLFVLDGIENKVINVVSSLGGEGKSFITINLALSLALLEKKVLIIGLDIRKPVLGEYLGMDNSSGITTYLTGHITKEQLILKSEINPNLFVIVAGPIPPNPNELLAKPALDKLLIELRKEFDYILIDTAPIGLVSDSFALNRLTDINLYVVRANYTPKKAIVDAVGLYKNKKLKNLYFVLNDIEKKKIGYNYSSGKNYGYGYGNENVKGKK